MQLASEGFVVLAFASDGLLVRPQFVGEIAQGGMGQRTVLAFLVPVVRPQREKNADADEDDFQDNVGAGTFGVPDCASSSRGIIRHSRPGVQARSKRKQPCQPGVVKPVARRG